MIAINGCAVTVTFRADVAVARNLSAMAGECGSLIVVDNGSDPSFLRDVAGIKNVELVPLGSNIGLAEGFNQGLRLAHRRGTSWAIIFDQDSLPTPGMLTALWETRVRFPAAGVVVPRIHEPTLTANEYKWLREHPRVPFLFERASAADQDLENVTVAISSGSLIDLELWNSLGGFWGDLFIDYIDVDYCLRVRRSGRSVAVSHGAVLNHSLGARQSRRILGRDLRPTFHAPFRHYYIARNRIALYRRHRLRPVHWVLFDLSFAFYNFFRILAFEDRKTSKIQAMIKGSLDGLRNRLGPMKADS